MKPLLTTQFSLYPKCNVKFTEVIIMKDNGRYRQVLLYVDLKSITVDYYLMSVNSLAAGSYMNQLYVLH